MGYKKTGVVEFWSDDTQYAINPLFQLTHPSLHLESNSFVCHSVLPSSVPTLRDYGGWMTRDPEGYINGQETWIPAFQAVAE